MIDINSNNNLVGIAYMVGGMFLLIMMDATAKWLVETGMTPVQVLAIRSWIIVLVILLVLYLRRELVTLRTDSPLQHGIRGIFGALAPLSFFQALNDLPLADATVVFFASTFILTAMSAIMFNEKVGVHRWGAVITGFAGVVIAVNPQGDGELSAYLLVLCAAFVYSALLLTGKHLAKKDSVISLVFSFNLMMGISTSLFLPLVWIPVSFNTFAILLLLAFFAVCGHIALTTAFSRAQVSAVAPFEYSSLVWAVILGYLFWADLPSVRVLTGALIIVVSGLYVIHRESLYLRGK